MTEIAIPSEFRIGISNSDVVEKDVNLQGHGVNNAARLDALSQKGDMTMSKNIFDYIEEVELESLTLGDKAPEIFLLTVYAED